MSPVHGNVLVQATGGARETQSRGKVRWAGLRRFGGVKSLRPSEDVNQTGSDIKLTSRSRFSQQTVWVQTVGGVQASEMFHCDLSFPVEPFLL